MSKKIYNKRGTRNYKEAKLVGDLNKKISENPNLLNEIEPANNFEELKRLHSKYCVEDIDFEETKNNSSNKSDGNKNNTFEEVDVDIDENKQFIDPFNREEPTVRDYVTDKGFADDSETKSTGNTSFDEPHNFKDAFDIPTGDDNSDKGTKSTSSTERKEKKEKPHQEPLNPNFDDMTGAKKKRNTKKFAKYIVEAVCMLSEKGFIWYANKDINVSKLAEYELNGEMDLDLMLTLDEGQQITVKEFFGGLCLQAEQLAKIDQEEKDDLSDALAEVMMEKGIAPTPMQELMLIALKIFGGQAIALMTLKAQSKGVLNQLRLMKETGATSIGDNSAKKQNIEDVLSKYEKEPIKQEEPVSVFENEDKIEEQAMEIVQEQETIINSPIPTTE